MKFKTFRALVVTGGLVVVAGGIVAYARHEQRVQKVERAQEDERLWVEAEARQRHQEQQPTTSLPAAASAPAPDGSQPLRPLDRQILDRVAQNISGDKAKDAIPGPAKVNLYRDAGQAKVNRLKIDLDRDEKWDEKWDFEDDGTVKRHVAPADDEVYSDEYRLREGAWVRK